MKTVMMTLAFWLCVPRFCGLHGNIAENMSGDRENLHQSILFPGVLQRSSCFVLHSVACQILNHLSNAPYLYLRSYRATHVSLSPKHHPHRLGRWGPPSSGAVVSCVCPTSMEMVKGSLAKLGTYFWKKIPNRC